MQVQISDNSVNTESKPSEHKPRMEQLTIEQTFSKKEPILDQIMRKGGCFRYQFRIVMLAALIMFVEGMEVCLSGLTFVPLMYTYNLNRFEACFAASLMFIAMAFGSIIAGFLSERERKTMIAMGLYIVFLGTLFSLIETVFTFILMRAVIGLGLGIVVPMMNGLLCEVLTPYFRGFWLSFVNMFFCFGAIFTTIAMRTIYFRDWKNPNPELFFIVLSTPVLLISILICLFLKESPRFLLTRKRQDEGFELLEHIYNGKIEEDNRTAIMKELARQNKSLDVSISSIFDDQFKLITFILTCVWIFYSYLVNGSVFSFMAGLLYSTSLSPEYLNEKYTTHSKGLVIIYSIFALSYLLAGLLAEVKCIGRKGLIYFGFLSVAVVSIVSIFSDSDFRYVLYFLDVFFINMSLHITNVYTCEVYPTKVRDVALGFFYFISRFVGFFANLIALFILETNSKWNIYINLLIGISGFILTVILPVETYRRALDVSIPHKKESSEHIDQIEVISNALTTTDTREDMSRSLDENEMRQI